MNSLLQYSFLDRVCLGFDQVLKTLTDTTSTTGTPYPAENMAEDNLTGTQRKQSAALMRINHAGEICAQALYHGQAMVSRQREVREKMQQAVIEEGDHLAWCKRRLDELGSHVSFLNPCWYTGSFCMGLLAGMIGDQWSLGFVAETERQVLTHLNTQLHLLPAEDKRSYRILEQMEADEAKHRDEAIMLGANDLPRIIKRMMSLTAKIMVKTAYWV